MKLNAQKSAIMNKLTNRISVSIFFSLIFFLNLSAQDNSNPAQRVHFYGFDYLTNGKNATEAVLTGLQSCLNHEMQLSSKCKNVGTKAAS